MTTASANERLDAVEAKLDDISAQLQILVDAQRPVVELRDEVGAMAGDVLRTSIEQLEFLEQRGYFAFLRELKYLVERVVEDYDPGDLHELADNAANILDTVRGLTQPSVMAVARAAADTFSSAEQRAPVGVIGLMRAVSGDKNVQRGLAFGLDLLGEVGRAVARAPRMSRKQLAPVERPKQDAKAEPAPVRRTPAAEIPDDCRFLPDAEWTPDVAHAAASALGLSLTDAHMSLVKRVRSEYLESGSTPNIRKITGVTGLSTREVYALFPQAPGKTIARLAGVPKPVGCL